MKDYVKEYRDAWMNLSRHGTLEEKKNLHAFNGVDLTNNFLGGLLFGLVFGFFLFVAFMASGVCK